MTTGSMSRRVFRFAGALALAGLTVACAGAQHGPTVAPAGYGKDKVSRAERLVQYCDRLVEKGERVTALGLCARAHEINPDNPEALMKVASILRSLDRTEAAAQTYGVLLERHPGHQEARYSLGKLYLESGEHGMAAIHFNQAMRTDPDDPRPYNALGILRDQAGEHEAAQALYRSALERDPKNYSVRNNLGLSLALNGQREEAIEVLADLAVDPAAERTVMRNLEAAYASRALPPSGDAIAGEAPTTETTPAMAAPGDMPPAEADPVEIKLLDNPPAQPFSVPQRSPAVTAPTVEATPKPSGSGGPTPLYPPKPSALREPQPQGDSSRATRPPSLSRPVTAAHGEHAEHEKPPLEQVTAAPSSVILAAAEMLMQPPAPAEVKPAAPITEVLPREAAADQPLAPENEAVRSDAGEVDAAPKPGTARFKSLSTGSVFADI